MIVADAADLVVSHVAGNAKSVLGAISWAGSPIAVVLGEFIADSVIRVIESSRQRAYLGSIEGIDEQTFDVTAHRSGKHVIFELEPRDRPVWSSNDLLSRIEIASSAFDDSNTLKGLCEIAAQQFRILTGFDRVLIYRFLDDGAGVVLAEDKREGFHSFLNHHFPASDIPNQARALYVRNLLRVIPDVDYVPAVLSPAWGSDDPLDLSDSILRSVSPVHLQYLRNMGVGASASVSIVKDGALWGLVACHHETPKKIFYDVRASCRTLASSLSRHIKNRKETDAFSDRLRLRSASDEIIAILARHGQLEEETPYHLQEMMRSLGSNGIAMVRGNDVILSGQCPTKTDVSALAAWLLEKTVQAVYHTDELSITFAPAQAFTDVASGVLALLISVQEQWQIIWFRAEETQVVNWAGNPYKDIVLDPHETLSPRASFIAWQETVAGKSRRWSPIEIETATRFRTDLIALRQAQNMRDLNKRLTEIVAEKDLLLGQKQFLIGEINHRVQNSLQLISSFLSLQGRESNDIAFSEAILEATRRIGAVSLLYRSLYRGDEIGVTDAGRYIAELIENLIGSMGQEWRPHFHLDLGPIMLPLDKVIPFGLIVTELVININKYAYGGSAGPIDITLTEDRTGVRVIVADRGRGRTKGRVGFGTRMMVALVSQLSGELIFEDNVPGSRAILLVPSS
jgi:chemotaxis family two-component system sensor kinase Cph1